MGVGRRLDCFLECFLEGFVDGFLVEGVESRAMPESSLAIGVEEPALVFEGSGSRLESSSRSASEKDSSLMETDGDRERVKRSAAGNFMWLSAVGVGVFGTVELEEELVKPTGVFGTVGVVRKPGGEKTSGVSKKVTPTGEFGTVGAGEGVTRTGLR